MRTDEISDLGGDVAYGCEAEDFKSDAEKRVEMSTYFEGLLSRPPLVTNEIPDDTFDTSSVDLTGPCIYDQVTGLSTNLEENPCPTTRPPTRPSSRSPGKFMRSVLTALSTGLRRIAGGG